MRCFVYSFFQAENETKDKVRVNGSANVLRRILATSMADLPEAKQDFFFDADARKLSQRFLLSLG